MKVGAIYPQRETGGSPEALDQIGMAVEKMGYDSLLLFDHVMGAVHEGRDPPLWGGYNEKDSFHDPLTAFSYLAGKTSRIEFITGVLILPQRQTALLARQAADVDLLSHERLTLGIGIGWNYVEYEALGEDFHTRGKKMDEQIPYLRRLWSEPVLSFAGSFHKLDRAALNPRPKRQIPLFCGGFGDAAFRRAAKLADGFIFAGLAEETIPAWARVRALLAENGRPVERFGGHLVHHTREKLDAATVRDNFRRWRDAGGTHASVSTMNWGFRSPTEHIDFLADVKQQLEA